MRNLTFADRILSPPFLTGLIPVLACAVCLAAPIRALADTPPPTQAPALAAPVLQVTGTKESLTLIADHADVLSVLSKLFAIANHDFTADHNVDGVVTTHLSNKSFLTVLNAVCEQTLLKYELRSGVYAISGNIAAREQAARQAAALANHAPGSPNQNASWEAQHPGLPLYWSGEVQKIREHHVPFDIIATPDNHKPYSPPSHGDDPSLYVQVELHISKDNPVPVVDALKTLAKQANIPIEISSDVPQGMKFRIWAHITNHTLLDALQLLAPTARLDWRIANGKLRISTAPEFQIFYGESNTPVVSYPPTGKPSQPDPKPAPNGQGDRH